VLALDKLEALREETATAQALLHALTRQMEQTERMQRAGRCIEQVQAYSQILTQRYEQLSVLNSAILGGNGGGGRTGPCSTAGFKDWLYDSHILPILQTELNAFLSAIDESFMVSLHTVQGKHFRFLVTDNRNTHTLDCASGYQRFCLGLAMRLVLARLGSAVGQNLKHLFVDEGFTACDSANLHKAKDMVTHIMKVGGYDSVLLISHLEAIRELAEVDIHVDRSSTARHSRIQFGQRAKD
jgi:hypothetical protein